MIIPAEFQGVIAPHLRKAPVDIKAIANALGLEIYQDNLAEGVSGAIIKDASFGTDSGFVILVNEKEAPVRQRFTAAHECGHFVLHRNQIGDGIHDNYMLRSDGLSTELETEANKFAAEVLMPYELIDHLIASGVHSVYDLAKELQVSQVAMAIRIGHPT